MRDLKWLLVLLSFMVFSLSWGCTGNIKTAPNDIAVEQPPPPDIPSPMLISPENNAVLDNGRSDLYDSIIWDFDWSDVLRANLYQIYVIGPGVKYPIINTSTISSSYHCEKKEYQSEREGLNSLSGWTWKVRAMVDGLWSEWSEVRTFNLEPFNTDPPQYPSLEDLEDSRVLTNFQADQINTFMVTTTAHTNFISIFQSFTPTASELKAVELLMRLEEIRREGTTFTINIRSGTFDGPVLGTTNAYIKRSYNSMRTGGSKILVPFMFSLPVSLIPGKVYLIEMIRGQQYIVDVWYASAGNPYAGGNAFLYNYRTGKADALPEEDFLFATYH